MNAAKALGKLAEQEKEAVKPHVKALQDLMSTDEVHSDLQCVVLEMFLIAWMRATELVAPTQVTNDAYSISRGACSNRSMVEIITHGKMRAVGSDRISGSKK